MALRGLIRTIIGALTPVKGLLRKQDPQITNKLRVIMKAGVLKKTTKSLSNNVFLNQYPGKDVKEYNSLNGWRELGGDGGKS